MREHDRSNPAEHVEPVEAELGEPLLVDPVGAVSPDGEVVGVGEAVLYDLAPAQEREPAVLDELLRERNDEQPEPEGNERDECDLLPEEHDEAGCEGGAADDGGSWT